VLIGVRLLFPRVPAKQVFLLPSLYRFAVVLSSGLVGLAPPCPGLPGLLTDRPFHMFENSIDIKAFGAIILRYLWILGNHNFHLIVL